MRNGDFTTGSIGKKLLLFMVPVLGSLVLQAMYGAVDLLVVGRFGSTAGLSGVSTGSQVLNLVTFVITGLAMGVTVAIGHALGAGRQEKIGPIMGGSIAVFGVIAVILCLIMVPFAGWIAEIMQAPAEALTLTTQYIRICGAGIFFIIAYNLISAVFRGLGDSKTPLYFVMIACCVNIAGDLLLVAVFDMDAAGAAYATVGAQAVSVVLSLIVMKKRLPYRIGRKEIRFNHEIQAAMRIGLPLGLQELLTQISFMALCAFVNRLGLEASSGYGIASKIVSFVMLVPSSLNQSMSSFVSQNVSAGREDRARKAMFTGMGIGIVIGIVIYLGIYFRGNVLAGLFSTDQAAVQNGWDYLKGFAPEAIVTAVLFSYNGYFNGHDRTVFIMISGILQTFAVRLPLAYYESIQVNASLTKIGFAAPCATCFGIVLCVIYDRLFMHQLKAQKKNNGMMTVSR
jgi:putative MATE family efflux protein